MILTDSLSLVSTIDSSNSPEINFLRFVLNETAVRFPLSICWVPGHCGIYQNEMADSLAKDAVSSDIPPCLDILSYFPAIVTNRYFKKLKNECTINFLADLSRSGNPSYSCLSFKINYSLFSDRFSEVHFCRFRNSRGMTREYGFRFCGLDSDLCICQIPFTTDSAEHFFCFCKFLRAEIRQLEATFLNHNIPYSLQNILSLGFSFSRFIPKATQQALAIAISDFLHSARSKGFLSFRNSLPRT